MTNLLSAQFSRLFRSKIFYISLILMLGIALYNVVPEFFDFDRSVEFHIDPTGYLTHGYVSYPSEFTIRYTELLQDLFDYDFFDSIYNVRLYADYYFKSNFTFYLIIIALMVSLLIGSEFGNNTIRNKIIVGHSRTSIYISNLIVCVTGGVIIQVFYILVTYIPMLILYFKYKSAGCSVYLFGFTFKENFVFQLFGLVIIILYSSIFMMITMITPLRTYAAMISLLVVITLAIVCLGVEQTLYEADMYELFYPMYDPLWRSIDDLEIARVETLSGFKREFYHLLDDVLPICQTFILSSSDKIPPRTFLYIAYDLGITAVTTTLGIALFNRKEIN